MLKRKKNFARILSNWPQPFPRENEMKDRISRSFDARNDIFFYKPV